MKEEVLLAELWHSDFLGSVRYFLTLHYLDEKIRMSDKI